MHNDIIIRINGVIDHIEKHISEELSLEKLARLANMSKFHFHRTFKMITQEAPNEYISRKRIEKIASLLTINTNESISSLSTKYGFENLSSFSRAFKKYYGMSATKFRSEAKTYSVITSSEKSKIGKKTILSKAYIYESEKLKEWMSNKASINVQFLPVTMLAYVRHWGSPYTINVAFDKLLGWCKTKDNGLISDSFYILFHDNPSLTEEYKIQQSAGVLIKNTKVSLSDISTIELPSQKYIIGQFDITESEFEKAWDSMIFWINEHNLKPKEDLRFEKFSDRSLFDQTPHYKVEIGIPIK